MTLRKNTHANMCIRNILLFLLFIVSPAIAENNPMTSTGHTAKEALLLGEAMYSEGMLPSGKPMTAVVKGTIKITGSKSTCANCHRKSGLGSLEGGVFTPPINGARLYVPLQGPQDIPGPAMKRSMFKYPRSAFNNESLANALLHGIGPTGRVFSETMPRYDLNEEEMKIMLFYLKNLSTTFSPGITDNDLRFATIVTENESPGDKDALILPLKAFLKEEWNEQNARLAEYNRQITVKTLGRSSRIASLDVWELKGSPVTWGKQLEAFYRQKPVFAILGGLVPGKWAPVHEFCEKNKIPCIFPSTDLPVISETDWYTVYFSKGFYQEGEAAAKYLSRFIDLPPDKQVVQVFRNTDEGRTLAQGFGDTWKKLGNTSLSNRTLSMNEKTGVVFWKEFAASHPNAVILLWLTQADLAGIEAVADSGKKPSSLFVSSTMLAGALTSLPDKIRDFTFITYPSRLSDEGAYINSIVTSWMKQKKIAVSNLKISSQAFFIKSLLSNILVDLGQNYYRDFFLDILDDSTDQANSSFIYPMLSFGPGQRYASKGCYVVTLTKGQNPQVVRQSDWVIY